MQQVIGLGVSRTDVGAVFPAAVSGNAWADATVLRVPANEV